MKHKLIHDKYALFLMTSFVLQLRSKSWLNYTICLSIKEHLKCITFFKMRDIVK